MNTEIAFVVEEAPECGYSARAVGQGLLTEADTLPELHAQVRDAVGCHFEPETASKLIRPHFVRDEVVAA